MIPYISESDNFGNHIYTKYLFGVRPCNELLRMNFCEYMSLNYINYDFCQKTNSSHLYLKLGKKKEKKST